MMHRLGVPILIAGGILAASCTTEFNTPDPDAVTDTSTDTTADAQDTVSDPSDAPPDSTGDVMPDLPPPMKAVQCAAEEPMFVEFEAGMYMDFGCLTPDDCSDVALYLYPVGDRVIVVSGGDAVRGTRDPSFYASVVDVTEWWATQPVRLGSMATDLWSPWIRTGSVVRYVEGEAVLLYVASRFDAGLGRETQNLAYLRLWTDGTGYVDQDTGVMFVADSVPLMEDAVFAHPRGVRLGGEYWILVQLEYEASMLSSYLTYAATLPVSDVHNSTLRYSLVSDFMMVEDAPDQMHVPFVPEVLADDTVTVPWLRFDFDVSFGAYRAGMWTFSGSAGPDGGPPVSTEILGPRAFTVSPAVASLGDGNAIMAAFSSDNAFNLTGALDPPQDLIAVRDGLDGFMGGALEAGPVLIENASLAGDLEHFDPQDVKILLDPVQHVLHYVHVTYGMDGNARLSIYSFLDDGTPAMRDMHPYVIDTGMPFVPASDIDIDPRTGHVYWAHFSGSTDGSGSLTGYEFQRFVCEVVDI